MTASHIWSVALLSAATIVCLCCSQANGDGHTPPADSFRRTTFLFLHAGMTASELQAYADAFARSGITGVIIGGGRHHYLHDDLPELDGYVQTARTFVAACRTHGIRVAEHHSVVLTTREDYAKEHAGWIQRDFETGEPSVWPEYQTWAFCPNNAAFREHYWRIASDLMRRTVADALMSDDTVFHHGCCCTACSERWKKETGGDIREAYAASRTAGSDAWRHWHAVRRGWFEEFRAWLWRKQQKELPGTLCLSLAGSALSPWGGQTHGGSAEGSLNTADIAVWEVYNPAEFYSWRRLNVEAAVMSEAARVRGIPGVMLPYADTAEKRDLFDPEEEIFGWGVAQAHGLGFALSRVFLTGLTPKDAPREYFTFERDRLARWTTGATEPAANVAVLFSRCTRDLDTDWEKSHTGPAIGWAESLQDAGLPFRALTEDSLDVGVPAGVDVVIAPNVFALSSQHLAALERFVRKGGTLVATGRTAFDTDDGSDALAVRRGTLEALYGLVLGAADREQPIRVEPEGAERLAGAVEAFRHAAGKGHVLYLPEEPGLRVMQDFQTEGKPFTDGRDRALGRSLSQMVRSEAKTPPVEVVGAEAAGTRLATVRRKGSTLLVFSLNTAGADLEPGAAVPSPSAVRWSESRANMTLRFSQPPRRVRLISMDFRESRILDRPGMEVTLPAPRKFALVVAEMPEN